MRFNIRWERVKLALWMLTLLAMAIAGGAPERWE